MIVDPNRVVKMGWLKLSPYSKIQQSGIDVSIDKICEITTTGLSAHSLSLKPWHSYDFVCHEYVEVPQDCVALIIVRSTFNRKGAFVTTGLYDNGFKNYIGGVLHTTLPLSLKPNERIGQIVFMQSEAIAQYDGTYQDRRIEHGQQIR